ncbi:TlpA disulfide reductase family protein [uncultured Dokdonia sp.]|uniref:TlpA family protein disulfide reductase n=1 Tax=uncultured Dokdonia sp. TaxID=575653 RepID=UPI00261E5521|nr:TlpA disulfide reductase family protein [uncultured Dokdonia sp.]
MRLFFIIYIIFISFSSAQTNDYGKPVKDPSIILKSFQNFWQYQNTYIKLSDDFIGLDTSSNSIDKGEFLRQLITGNYLPLRLQSKTSIYYKLSEVDYWDVKDIRNTTVNLAKIELWNYTMENNLFPKFNAQDLNGNNYSNESLKDKTVVLKLWFIGCQQCIKEMPSLNKLFDTYKNRKDLVFLSMALDEDDALRKFLKKRKFDFPVIGNQNDFLKNKLRTYMYPTHIIINKEGKIVKVVNSYEELEKALKKNI